jgi:hypothetical protein
MTPEQTLDWLAQQHFDQCREDRPVQHWIRKMKSELPEQETVAGKGKEYSEQLKLCARNVAFVSAGYVNMSSAAIQEMFALIDHVCAGIDSPPLPEERNFCQRCGKRTADPTTIHTCTPPQENT